MGGGKGGGSGRTPIEKPDTLKSKQLVELVELISEGPIAGPVDGLESVFLNDTPVENEDGTSNFPGVEMVWRSGHQVQDPLPGMAAVQNEVAVSVEVKAAVPLVRTVTNPEINRVRVTVGTPSLLRINKHGDRIEAQVAMLIQRGRAGNWETVHTIEWNDKTTSLYTESHEVFALSGGTPWDIRVVRVTPDSTSDTLQNKTSWVSYTEIIDAQLTFPNSAVVGLRFDSEQFQSIPRRNYLIRGLVVRVPSNYIAETRTYTGIWDGSWRLSWTDNPAWILFDLLTNERYGMGRSLSGFEPDKWRLYEIAMYCDQLVDDGYGGQEPRFTCNLYLADQRQAHEVISNLVSVFRGMPVWDGLQYSFNQDRPQDSVWQFNNSNVVDGAFRYQSSSLKSRHTAVQVEYLDRDNGWTKQVEYVQDDDMVARYGLHIQKVTAFGCTSRGQAHRTGQWILVTEKLERQAVTFEVGREGIVALPGDIVEVIDNHYAGARLGGRVLAVNGLEVTLDAEVELYPNQQNWFHYLDHNSQLQQLEVMSPTTGISNQLTLSQAPIGLQRMDTFNLSTARLTPRKWRVMGISENRENGTYAYSCLQHVPEKHAIIEDGLLFDPPSNTLHGGRVPAIEHLTAEVIPDTDPIQVRLSWDTPRMMAGIRFELRLLRNDRVVRREVVSVCEYHLRDGQAGAWQIEVRAINEQEQKGPATSVSFSLGPPQAPFQLQLTPSTFSIEVRPVMSGPVPLGTVYEFWGGSSRAQVEAQTHYLGRGYLHNQQGLIPSTTYWYGVQAVNSMGRSGLCVGSSKTLLIDGLVDLLAPEIPKIEWAKDLSSMVENNSSKLLLLNDRVALVVNKDGRVTGMTITAESQATAIDFLSDFVSFTDPVTLQRNMWWDNIRKKLVVRGHIEAESGTFDNVLIGQNCEVRGKLYAEHIIGDVAGMVNLAQGWVSDGSGGGSVSVQVLATPFARTITLAASAMVFGGYKSTGGDNQNGPTSAYATLTATINGSVIASDSVRATGDRDSDQAAVGFSHMVPPGSAATVTLRLTAAVGEGGAKVVFKPAASTIAVTKTSNSVIIL